jgi:hypothetical protein
MDDEKRLVPQESSEVIKQKEELAKRGLQLIDEFCQADIGVPGTKKHMEAVGRWLEAHVKRYSASNSITLFDFQIDWKIISGSFKVLFDNIECSERISFGPDVTGRPIIYLPMFTSPLGAPASYPAIEFPDKEERAILQGLYKTIPSLRPYGIDIESGKLIYVSTPIEQRIISIEEMEIAKAKLANAQYSVTVIMDDA